MYSEPSRRPAHDRLAVLALLLTAAWAALAAGCQKKAPVAFARPPAPVTVAQVIAQDVPVYLDEVGKIVASELVEVLPQVSGRITAIEFEDGADVKKGDLLFTIDPRPFEAALASAKATLAQQTAALEWNKVELKRSEELLGTKDVAQSDYDLKKNQVDVAQALVQQAEAAVQTATINLDYCTISSPIDGRAGRRLVDVGNVVSPGAAGGFFPLLTIQRLDPIYASFTVTESDLTPVQRSLAKGPVRVEVRLPDEPAEPIVGELNFIDNAVQEGMGSVRLRATVANADRRLWPGRFVKVRVVLETIAQAALIPAGAPQVSAKGQFVYVIKSDETAEMRPIKTGQRQGDLLVVESGVQPGERVVVNGQIGVMPGGKVQLVSAAAAPAPPAPPAPAKDKGPSADATGAAR